MTRTLLLGPLLIAGCGNQLPGEPVATYRIVMSLVENTCGSQSVILTDGQQYSVELRRDGERGYWHRTDSAAVQGKFDADHNFEFTSSAVVASELDAGVAGCKLVQDEVLTGSLRAENASDAGESAEAGVGESDEAGASADASVRASADAGVDALVNLVGEHTLRITSLAGTDCSRALMAAGGPFEALPCTVRYKLMGVKRDPF